jgi:uncharacterized secreted repeat protein (TIGR03808 family)
LAIDRRTLLGYSAAGATLPLGSQIARAAPSQLPALGVDATVFGVRPDATDDQSDPLQLAIDAAARRRVPLIVPPGVYQAADLVLPSGIQIFGVRGASRLLLTYGASLLAASGANEITLQGLVLDGNARTLPDRRGLLTLRDATGVRVVDCALVGSGGNGIALERVEGEIAGNTILAAAKAAIFSLDARGLTLTGNTIREAGNNGILVWRSTAGDDGTLVLANRIEDVAARDGGSGQNGNGINVFRAANVVVADNRIRNCAFSAVRGNAASNLQIRGNSALKLGEVAIYSEFGFEGALISHNVIDGAALGISITNFNHGGRLAVCQGNLVRNLFTRGDPAVDKEARGIGIAAEADTAVTGNVIEGAPVAGIWLGWKQYLRDVTATGNLVRSSPIGIAVSVTPGAGSALVADNLIVGASRGAVVGMDGLRAVTGDLTRDGASRFAQLTITGNRVQ